MKIKRLFGLPAFHALLFCLFFALFDWPVVTITSEMRTGAIFIYLFMIWAILVFLLFIISMGLKPRNSGGIQREGMPDA